jgi:hypothetical protein
MIENELLLELTFFSSFSYEMVCVFRAKVNIILTFTSFTDLTFRKSFALLCTQTTSIAV